jgi:hypothetical protein
MMVFQLHRLCNSYCEGKMNTAGVIWKLAGTDLKNTGLETLEHREKPGSAPRFRLGTSCTQVYVLVLDQPAPFNSVIRS